MEYSFSYDVRIVYFCKNYLSNRNNELLNDTRD